MAVMPMAQFNILAGASGAGKTTLALQCLLAHERKRRGEATDEYPIQFAPEVDSFGIIVADRTKEEVQNRIKFLGIQTAEVYGLADDATLPLSLLDTPWVLFQEIMNRRIGKHKQYFLDPIALFMEGSMIDFKSVAKTLIRFNRYVIDNKVSILGMHHTTKARSDFSFLRPQDRISGSGAFPGYSGTQCMLVEGKESKVDFDTLTIVPHMTPLEEHRLVRREDGYFSIQQFAANETVKDAFEYVKNQILRLQDFKSNCAIAGMTDAEVMTALEEGKDWQLLPGGFVKKVS